VIPVPWTAPALKLGSVLDDWDTRLVLLQHLNYLLFAEPSLAHELDPENETGG
jgi:hypothetical protein